MANDVSVPVVRRDLRIDGSKLRRVTHDERICSQYHQCPGTLRKVRNDYPKLTVSNRRLHQRRQFLSSVDVAAACVQEKIDAFLGLDVVQQFHEPSSVVAINHRRPARDVTDQTASRLPFNRLDELLPMITRSVNRLVHWCFFRQGTWSAAVRIVLRSRSIRCTGGIRIDGTHLLFLSCTHLTRPFLMK
jgi:hypothetical protein